MSRSAFEFTIAMPGLRALTVGMSRLRHDIADWTPFWRDTVGPLIYRNVLQNFVSEGANSGAPWAALSPAYGAWKQRHYPGRGILVRAGALKASLSGPDAPDAVFHVTPTTVEVGTSVPYARYQQLGAKRLPQRPPLRVPPAMMTVLGKEMNVFVERTWQRARAESGGV